jgi:tetratricopeptide (TPR) repeat protein
VHATTQAQGNLDSLENVLKQDIADSTRVKILLRLSDGYQYIAFAKSKEYAEQALQLANDNNYTLLRIESHQAMGSLSTISGDYTTALKFDNQALQLSLPLKDTATLSRSYNLLANDYYDLGEYDEAYFYFKTSYKLANGIHDSLQMTVAMHNVGLVFKEL